MRFNRQYLNNKMFFWWFILDMKVATLQEIWGKIHNPLTQVATLQAHVERCTIKTLMTVYDHFRLRCTRKLDFETNRSHTWFMHLYKWVFSITKNDFTYIYIFYNLFLWIWHAIIKWIGKNQWILFLKNYFVGIFVQIKRDNFIHNSRFFD